MNKEEVYFLLREMSSIEKNILLCLVRGLSNQEIATELNINEKAVEYQLKKIYKKFDVKIKRELLFYFVDDFILKILKSPVL